MASTPAAMDNIGMQNRRRISLLQQGAGVLTWAIVTGVAAWVVHANGLELAYSKAVYISLAVANLVAMLVACTDNPHVSLLHRRIAHGFQLASALALGWTLPLSFLPIYTIIWAAIASGLYPERTTWWQLAGVMTAWYVVMIYSWKEDGALISVLLYGTFHLFAVLTARNASEAEAARDRAEFLNSELLATQHLLSEASRQSERTRIARDLHDMLGHHLTALSINLQIAERLADGEARSKIAESRALARLLLSDVRDAVSTLREESAIDFNESIRLLAERVPQLDIDLDIEDGLTIDEFDVAESLLRCVQEALTNTLRHSGATRSWIRVWQENSGVHMEIRDDGASRGALVEGNGLKGMRERLERLRGSLQLDTVDDALCLRVVIPHAG